MEGAGVGVDGVLDVVDFKWSFASIRATSTLPFARPALVFAPGFVLALLGIVLALLAGTALGSTWPHRSWEFQPSGRRGCFHERGRYGGQSIGIVGRRGVLNRFTQVVFEKPGHELVFRIPGGQFTASGLLPGLPDQ